MSLITVQGRYKDGKVDLAEAPSGIHEAKVLVTFLPGNQPPEHTGRQISYGQFSGPHGQMSTDDDFKQAEWHPKSEDLDV